MLVRVFMISSKFRQDSLFGVGIYGRKTIVKDENCRVLDQRSGDGHPRFAFDLPRE